MEITIILILGIVLSLVATIFCFVSIIPEKKRAKLKGFGRFLHDFFNFKFLIIEKIIQFCYVLATSFTLIGGFLMLFWFEERYDYGAMMDGIYGGGGYNDVVKEWVGYYGLIVMILGPIVLRLAYELLMLAIIAVRNLIQINNKIPTPTKEKAPETALPISDPAPAPGPKFCTKCGTPLGDDGKCQNPECK